MKLINSVLSLGMLLTGCQQSSKKFCENTNWRKEGFFTALNGKSRRIFEDYSKKCKEKKVELNSAVFNEGFDEGASQFCERSAAIAYGAEGLLYDGTCEDLNEVEFLKSYRKGRLSFFQRKYNSKKTQLEESESRVWRKNNEFKLEVNTNPGLASIAYDELESLKAENERLKSELMIIKESIRDLKKE